jgi:hypothetical protein
MNQETKRHLISFGVTFATGFAIAVLPQIDSISLSSFQDGALVGIVFAAVRAGIKAVLEAYLAWRASK